MAGLGCSGDCGGGWGLDVDGKRTADGDSRSGRGGGRFGSESEAVGVDAGAITRLESVAATFATPATGVLPTSIYSVASGGMSDAAGEAASFAVITETTDMEVLSNGAPAAMPGG